MNKYISHIKKSLVYIGFFSILGAVSGIALRTILARSLGPEEYGLFYAVFSFVFFFVVFRDLGIGSGFQKLIPKWIVEKKTRTINQAITFNLLVQILFFVVFAALVALFNRPLVNEYFANSGATLLLIILMGTFLFESFLNTLLHVFVGLQKSGAAVSINAIRISVVAILSYVFLEFGLGFASPAYAYLAATSILVFVYALILKFRYFPKFKLVKTTKKVNHTLIKYGKFFILTGAASVVLTNTDSLLLTYYAGVTATGIYNAALPLTSIIFTLGGLFFMILTPLVSELATLDRRQDILQGVEIIYRYFFVIALPVIGCFIVFPTEIILLFFGSEFIAAAPVLAILSVGTLMFMLAHTNFSVLIGLDDVKSQAYTFASIAGINVVLNILLIPAFGAVGAAVATSIGYLLALIISFIVLQTKLKMVIPWRDWIKNAIVVIVTVIIVFIAHRIINAPHFVEASLLLLILMVVYSVGCWLSGLITVDRIKEVQKLIRG